MSVVDASALVELLLQTEIGRKVEDRLLGSEGILHAPHLIDVEATQALRKLVQRRDLPETRARVALDDLALLPLIRYPHFDFLPRVWALRENLTAYDAIYVALAEILGETLVTCDRPLSRSSGHAARIDCIV